MVCDHTHEYEAIQSDILGDVSDEYAAFIFRKEECG
jgi:hypothetical protein